MMPRQHLSWFFLTITSLAMVLLMQDPIAAQDEEDEWDVTLARGDTRDIDFETNTTTSWRPHLCEVDAAIL